MIDDRLRRLAAADYDSSQRLPAKRHAVISHAGRQLAGQTLDDRTRRLGDRAGDLRVLLVNTPIAIVAAEQRGLGLGHLQVAGHSVVELTAADVDVLDEQHVGPLGNHDHGGGGAKLDIQRPLLLVFVAAELLAVAADQRERLDIDGRDAEPGLLGGRERLTERSR